MVEILRLVDADESSLAARVQRAVHATGGPCVVDRFVVWYTTRPPVHHAVLRAEAPPDALQ